MRCCNLLITNHFHFDIFSVFQIKVDVLSQTLDIQKASYSCDNKDKKGGSAASVDYNRINVDENVQMFGTSALAHGNTLGATNQIAIKIENLQKDNQLLQATVGKLNCRLGDEIIHDSESDDNDSDVLHDENVDPNINTLHFQLDSSFAAKYYYITDVSSF